MIKIHYTTNGRLNIELINASFGKHIKEPTKNLKSYYPNTKNLEIVAEDMNNYTDWGIIEIIPDKEKQPVVNASITSDTWGWYADTQIEIEKDGQTLFNDLFESGLKGPVGNPIKYKSYPLQS